MSISARTSVDKLRTVRAGDVGATLGTSASVLLMLAAANVIIARTLGVRGQGMVAAATLIPLIVGYGGEMGISVATGYLINVSSNERALIVGTARRVGILVSVVLFVVAVLLVSTLPLAPGIRALGLLFCPFVCLNVFYRLHLAILQADLRVGLFNAVRVSGAATYLLLVGAVAVGEFASEWAVIAALLAGNSVWCASAWKVAAARKAWAFDRRIAKVVLSYGVRAHLGNVSAIDALRIDQLVLALFLSTSQLGLYVAAITVITGNRVIGTSIGAMCFPLASRGKRGKDPRARSQFRKLLATTVTLSSIVALLEFLVADRLLRAVFGSSFASAASVLRTLAIASIFMNIRQVYADWLRGSGRLGVVAGSEAIGVASLAVIATVLWDGSVEAVAVAMSVASVVAAICLVIGGTMFRPGEASMNIRRDAVEGLPA